MSTFNVGVRVGLHDDTRAGLRSVFSGISSLARTAAKPIIIPFKIAQSGMGFLRDFNLGLSPVVAGLDRAIQRGAGLGVVMKAFETRTGKSGDAARGMANEIVRASQGAITMSRAMQLANRAGDSLDLNSLKTAVEFISKKSIATGKDAGDALDTVITGLIRGSTLFLDDFGILVDGMDGVKRTFDSIKGSGAFDALGPAAQKAETIKQAINEMRGQMTGLGISGKETIFVYQSIKAKIEDITDGLFLSVAKSKALKDALTGVRDILGGVKEHFDKGGSFKEILFGKGKSGGLAGIAGSFFLDLGENIGRGIAGGILKVLSNIPQLFTSIKTFFEEPFNRLIETLRGMIPTVRDLFDKIPGGKTARNIAEGTVKDIGRRAVQTYGVMKGNAVNVTEEIGKGDMNKAILQNVRGHGLQLADLLLNWSPLGFMNDMGARIGLPDYRKRLDEEKTKAFSTTRPAVELNMILPELFPVLISEVKGQTSILSSIRAGVRSLSDGVRKSTPAGREEASRIGIAEWLGKLAKDIFSGMGWARSAGSTDRFTNQFKSADSKEPAFQADPGRLPLAREGMAFKQSRVRQIGRELGQLGRDPKLKDDARREAHAQAQRLRGFIDKDQVDAEIAERIKKQGLRDTPLVRHQLAGRIRREHRLEGREVRPQDEREMARQIQQAEIARRRAALIAEREKLNGELDDSLGIRKDWRTASDEKLLRTNPSRYTRRVERKELEADDRRRRLGEELMPHGGPSYEDLRRKLDTKQYKNAPGSDSDVHSKTHDLLKEQTEMIGQQSKMLENVGKLLASATRALVGEERQLAGGKA